MMKFDDDDADDDDDDDLFERAGEYPATWQGRLHRLTLDGTATDVTTLLITWITT